MSSTLFSLDIETTGLDRFSDKILCIGVYSPDEHHCFRTVSEFAQWLRPEHQFILHRGSFDVNFLRHNGVAVSSNFFADTKSLASILVPIPKLADGQKHIYSLENLSISLLGLDVYKLNRTRMSDYSWEELSAYNLEDCKRTYNLYQYCISRFEIRDREFVDRWLMPATKLCMELEWNGIPIDAPFLASYKNEITEQRDRTLSELNELSKQAIVFYHEKQVEEVTKTYKELYEKAKEKTKDKAKCLKRYALLEAAAISRLQPFNWNSSTQLKWLLRDYYCLNIVSDREYKETTNEAMLKTLDHPVAKKLVDYRELEKLCSTCIPALLDNLKSDGMVHASYNIGGTRTGRLSSSSPNLQQIPRGQIRESVRSQSVKPETVLVTIDYAQIEVRIIAEIAKEEELINAFKEKIDPYSVIAQKLFKIDCPVKELKERFKKERDVAKTAGLSILYGTGPGKLQEVLRKELGREHSIYECRGFIESYRNSLPGVKQLRRDLERKLANGKKLYNLLGRPFSIESNDDIYMTGLNTLVQGSASDLVIWSQTNFVIPELKKLGVNATHRMLIHDEVVIELEADEAELLTTDVIVPAMTSKIEEALHLTVPLAVEYNISKSWSKP